MTLEYNKRIPRIGQGGYIIQIITLGDESIQIIFDCGTVSYQTILAKEIKRLRKDIDTYLIISHLHADHINCVQLLKSEGVNVSKIFLPNMRADEIILEASISESDSDAEFIISPRTTFPAASIITIDTEEGDDVDELSSSGNALIRHTATLKLLSSKRMAWFARFYVYKAMTRPLSHSENALISSIKSIDDLIANKPALRTIYKNISGANFNLSSMMAFVFPAIISPHTSVHLEWICCSSKSLIMCTGDIPISCKKDSDSISLHYNDQQYLITDVMLPHHGGDNYFTHNPFPNMIRAYAQTGPYSKYKHPGANTLKTVDACGSEFYNVTSNGKY